MDNPSVPSPSARKGAGAAFPKAKGGSRVTVVRRGANTAIPQKHCTAKRAAFRTGTGRY